MFVDRIDWFEGALEFALTKQKFAKAKILEVWDKTGKLQVFKYKRKMKVVHRFEDNITEMEVKISNLKINKVAISWSASDKKIEMFINGKKIAEQEFFLKPSYIG